MRHSFVAELFALDLSKFRDKVKDNTGTVVRKVVYSMAQKIVMRSPVDTGRFRGNWFASLNMPNIMTTPATDRGGSDTLRKANSVISAYEAEKEQDIWITNSLPYAIRLENGWSGQAPHGMVKVTVVEFQDMVNSALRGLK
jgi:hypothetical protein